MIKNEQVLFLIDNTIINDKSCFSFLKSAVKDAGIEDAKFVNIFKNPDTPKDKMPEAYPDIVKYVKKFGFTKVVTFGNNGIFTCGFVKKPEQISKFRGKVLDREELPGVNFFALESPFAVDRDRTREVTFRADLALIKRVSEGKFEPQVKMKIYDIESPEDIDELIKVARETGHCAYDYETSGLEKNEDIVGTATFCPKIDDDGVAHVWFYAEYDQLVPRFTPEKLEKLKEKFTFFFDLDQEENFDRIAWNQNFDDWMTETWLGKRFEMSTWDAMFMKWTINTQRPHNLKYSTAIYLGYPEYDEFFEKKVAEVKARRGRNLTHEEDFQVLKFFGVEPDKTVKSFKTKPDKITYKWPKNISKAKAAYLTVDLDIVREYNCLGGDTKILTKEYGLVPIKDLKNKQVHVLDGNSNWVLTTVNSYGIKKTYELLFRKTLGGNCSRKWRATLDHRWITLDKKEFLTKNLPKGAIIPSVSTNPIIDETSSDYLEGVHHGLIYGDGTTIYKPKDKSIRYGFQIRLCKFDHECLKFFKKEKTENKLVNICYPKSYKGDPIVTLRGNYYRNCQNYKEFPDHRDYSDSYMVGFLRGWLSADGCVSSEKGEITLSGITEKLLKCAEIFPIYGFNFRGCTKVSPGGYPNAKDNRSNLRLCRESVQSGDILMERKKNNLNHSENHFVFIGVDYSTEKEEEVFCCTVPTTSSFVTDEGLLTGNCLDSAYTLMLFLKFKEMIIQFGLEESCELRHRAGRLFMRGEQHGILLDVELNRKWEKELQSYINQTREQLQQLVIPYLPDHRSPEDFNPGSADHINEVFYGELGLVPFPDTEKMLKYFKDEDILKLVNEVEEEIYEDYADIKELLRSDDFDFLRAKEYFEEELYSKIFDGDHDIDLPYYVNENYRIPFTTKALGLGGLELNPVGVTKTGKPSTSKSSLLSLATQRKSDIIDLVLMYRKCVKYKTAFIDKIYEARDENNIVRTAHNATGTATGRSSSSKSGEKGFNIQQIPSIFKRQFIARPGYGILSLDLSQAEVYTLAAFANDSVLKEALQQRDLHKYVASQIFKISVDEVTKDQRSQGKTSLFLTVYGGGAKKLASAFENMKVSTAQSILDDFKSAFQDSTNWLENQKELGRQEPHFVYTAFGTRISVSGIMSEDYSTVLRAERICGNAPIQGTAGEVMIYKQANLEDQKYEENLDFNWLMSVHDQGGWEVPLKDVNVEIYTNEKGEEKQKLSGKGYDIIAKEFSKTVPFAPIEDVVYKIDAEFYTRWGGEDTDLAAGLSSEKPGDIFRWDLILDEDEETDVE